MKIFAERLRQVRTGKKVSRQELADALGLTISQISDMENGRRGTTLEKLVNLCRYLNVSADYLLGLTDEQRPYNLSSQE